MVSFRRLPLLLLLLLTVLPQGAGAWQQRVHYTMEIAVDPATHSYTGVQQLLYVNNSPDTLREVYYHLYYQAFRRGSMMDQRDSILPDMSLGIGRLRNADLGSVQVESLVQEGARLEWTVEETTLHAHLERPLAPGDSTLLQMRWTTYIPRLTRRGGWMSREGIEYSMSQWYPKLAAYDRAGWHNDEYVGREFYGVFGTFDVAITLPGSYIVGATGVLMNPEEMGCGYELGSIDTTILHPRTSNALKTWRFHAENVHDFAWTADADYAHQITSLGGTTIHALYDRDVAEGWRDVGLWTRATMAYFNRRFGPYLWPSFTVAQAGDGGMEYPMLIMITGNRSQASLAGVIAHELGHQWYYGMMANNETEEAWLDEGFAQYLTNEARREVFGLVPAENNPNTGINRLVLPWTPTPWSHTGEYYDLMAQGRAEPLSTWHDHFHEGTTAGTVYSTGEGVLRMLQSMVGDSLFDRGMRVYHRSWHFRHPSLRDFERAMEEGTGLRLDWFFHGWIVMNQRLDLAMVDLQSTPSGEGYTTRVEIERREEGVMGFDLRLRYEDGSQATAHISPEVWQKPGVEFNLPRWNWIQRRYTATFTTPKRVVEATIDTSLMMLDIDRTNNTLGSGLFGALPPARFGLYTRWDLDRPLDSYTLRLRPTLWYAEREGAQIGFLLDGGYTWRRYEARIGAAYNTRSQRIDYTLGYGSTLPLLGVGARYGALATNVDGVQRWEVALSKVLPNLFSYQTTLHEFSVGAAREVLVGPNYPSPSIPWSPGGWNTIGAGYRFRLDSAEETTTRVDLGFRTSFDSPTSFTQWTVAAGTELEWLGLRFSPELFAGVSRGGPPAHELFSAAGARGGTMHRNVVHRMAATIDPEFAARNRLILPTEGYLVSLAGRPVEERLFGSVVNARLAVGNLNPFTTLIPIPLLKQIDLGVYAAGGFLFPGTLTFDGFGTFHGEAGALASLDLLKLLPATVRLGLDSPNPIRLSLFVPLVVRTPLLPESNEFRWALGVSW